MQVGPPVWQECGWLCRRHTSGRAAREAAHEAGLEAERLACEALRADGWTIRGQRLRNAAGEIDIAAERDGILSLIEVKRRPTLGEAAQALGPRQRARLIAAAEILIGQYPQWGTAGIRFDVMLVDAAGAVRRITDAFRAD